VAADLQGRIVVVSPHSDDGVLSLGAAMASWARKGHRVELLTVFALDPGSSAETRGWDRRGGLATEGEAARVRREEDRRACAVLGAVPTWLPFGSVDYERHGDEGEVRAAVAAELMGADAVLLPGFPLSHPDHEWLVRVCAGTRLPGRVGLYAEQPYAWRSEADPGVPAWLADLVGTGAFGALRTGARDRFAKWRAVARYRSQLPLLAMRRSVRRGPHVLAFRPELVAWVGERDRASG
jgi:LmbE family N-acetylglucosaminyl deacetylase